MNTWNRERKRTRDRLLDYDFKIVPPNPHSAGLAMLYPWESTTLAMISYQLYYIAQQAGFTGTQEDFFKRFGSNDGQVVKCTIATFPIEGNTKNLYLDEETGIVYYYRQSPVINMENAIENGAVIVSENSIYIPISALLIENTILNCGDAAAEYIG